MPTTAEQVLASIRDAQQALRDAQQLAELSHLNVGDVDERYGRTMLGDELARALATVADAWASARIIVLHEQGQLPALQPS